MVEIIIATANLRAVNTVCRHCCVLLLAALLFGCASKPTTPSRPQPLPAPSVPRNDGPDPRTPVELMQVPDAVPRAEPIRPGGPNKPYEVEGQRYEPLPADERYEARGLASWYGRQFHGRKTANGETFNMYAMTAAHRTLPLPSYARVSNPANGRSVIVRVNDRGPFIAGRIIDLSYTAAVKLGIAGVVPVRVERVLPQDMRNVPAVIDGDAVPDAAEPPEAPKATPVADAKPAPRETTPNAAARGYWLQLGAYRELQGAITLQKQAGEELPALAPLLTLIEQATTSDAARLHRVQAGPFASREEADAAAAQVRGKLLLTPVVIQKR
jgi:rare lipoprotein A